MKRSWFPHALAVVTLAVASCLAYGSDKLSGTYFGYEPLPNLSPGDPDAYWYYEVTLVVTDTKVRVSKAPRIRVKGKVTSTSSDGGFPVFEGTVRSLQDRTVVAVRQTSCDYCGKVLNDPLPPGKEREYIVLFAENGMFEFDRIRFSRNPDPNRSLKRAPDKSPERTRER